MPSPLTSNRSTSRRVNDASYITINSMETTSQEFGPRQMRVEVTSFSLRLSPQYYKEPNLLMQKGDEDVSFLKIMRGREEKEERGGCLGDNIIDDVIIAPARLDGRNRDGGNETTD